MDVLRVLCMAHRHGPAVVNGDVCCDGALPLGALAAVVAAVLSVGGVRTPQGLDVGIAVER
jgi:hypothetical protein